MARSRSADGGAYWSCEHCAARYHASSPAELLRRGAGVRLAEPRAGASVAADRGFDAVKARLESFLRRLDDEDPWFVLGVPPGAPIEQLRSRYRELALEHHPDRGGDPAAMRRFASAYDRVRSASSRVAEVPSAAARPATVARAANVRSHPR